MINDLLLIELVRRNEVLYDKRYGGYRNPGKKKDVWRSIAKELGEPDEQCMKRWTSLRERYSRECKRLDTPTGSTASYGEPWPLLDPLGFLREHVKQRTRKSMHSYLDDSLCSPIQATSLPSTSPQLDFSVESPKLEYSEVSPKMEYRMELPKLQYTIQSPKLECTIESPRLEYSSSTEKYSDEPNATTSTVRVKKRKANSTFDFEDEFREVRKSLQAACEERMNEKKNAAVHDEPNGTTSTMQVKKRKANSTFDFEEEFREVCKSFQAACQERINEKKNTAVHAFGQMIVATICEFSARKQAQAMKQITDIVMTLKLEEEEEDASALTN